MKYLLFLYIFSVNGNTATVTEFESVSNCQQAAMAAYVTVMNSDFEKKVVAFCVPK